ncbi:MAG TPA: TonB-dependent copper receptor [Holophagaceae bacterium]
MTHPALPRAAFLLCALPCLAAAEAETPRKAPGERPVPSAVVEVAAPLPQEPLVTVTDPKAPRQPVPAHDGAEYLKTIPGFAVIRKGGTDGDPVLRGMAGSRLNLLVDGEQLLGGCGARMDPPTAYVFPESFDRITVIKGPQTVLYGPGNSAGTVLFERTGARLQRPGWRGTASLLGGSWGRNDEVVDATGGTPDVYVRGAGTRSHMGDYRDGNGNAIHSRYTRWSAFGALGWTPDDRTRLELSGTRSDGRAAYADRSMDGAMFRRENLDLKFETRNLSPLVERLEAQVYWNHVDHVMDNATLRTFTPTPMAPEPAAMNPDRTTQGGRVAATLRLAEPSRLVLGSDLQANRHTFRMSLRQWSRPEESLPRMDDACFRSIGLFGELTQALSPVDRLVAGFRTDRWHAEDRRSQVQVTMMATAPDPTAGQRRDTSLESGFLRYERELAGGGTTLYAGVGHAERFPDYWEAISKESLATVSAFGTRPERTTQLDLGFVQQTGALRTSVSAFYGEVRDFILIQSNVAKPAMGGTTRLATVARNVDATTWGGEAAATLALTSRLKAEGSLSYVHGSNDTDHRPLGQMPPLEGRLGLTWDTGTWSLGGLLRAVDRQGRVAVNQGNIVGQDLGPTAGFAVVSLNGGWRPRPGLLVTAGVDNLFNRAYAEHLSRNAASVPGFLVQSLRVNEPGRMAWLKLALTFG